MNLFRWMFLPLVFFLVGDVTPGRTQSLGKSIGYLRNPICDEISGIALSVRNSKDSIFFVHNDSGDSARFFAMDRKGNIKATYFFADQTLDCEDIAVGVGPNVDKSYVYVGDIGDNWGLRSYVTIYRVEEPALSHGHDSVISLKKQSTPIHVAYPDRPHDSECLMVDPIERLIYLVTKREDSVHVYTLPIKSKYASLETFTFRTKLPLRYITAGDISADGRQVVIKNYGYAYYWVRQNNEPIWKTMLREPIYLPYNKEKQGEAVCIDRDGKHFITVGEGLFSKIMQFDLP